ncbi:MAG: BrnT family toxin [Steroidobacteraceae bacterium]
MEIEFDPPKDARNQAKHGLSLADAERLDWDGIVAREDRRRNYGEQRMIGMSRIGKRLHVVVFTERGDAVRIISLRKANKREVKDYEATQARQPKRR